MTKRLAASALGPRLEALRDRHRQLDALVHEEYRRPLPDLDRLRSLKRDRLRLKDALSELEGTMRTIARAPGQNH
ncbi:hypothetical protein Ga0609869_002033 [Rhodovulum iodosum]|uniref:DUF465 domain-containing protein n=1 Tax=Rhodovulum iodosum TaxID=68291 RepID=A0ABV3XV53_9RHOB|nr:YdcH family protein [Rhodovulum robiginosum]RSK32126.1 DUF465 domain-containing protein [Rhodovulum robiginosum]